MLVCCTEVIGRSMGALWCELIDNYAYGLEIYRFPNRYTSGEFSFRAKRHKFKSKVHRAQLNRHGETYFLSGYSADLFRQ